MKISNFKKKKIRINKSKSYYNVLTKLGIYVAVTMLFCKVCYYYNRQQLQNYYEILYVQELAKLKH